MKKFVLIAALLVLALGALVLPAAAQDTDLTTMAQYLPADAPVYFGFRTDDQFIQSVDGLAEKLSAIMPTSFRQALDKAADMMSPGGTFDTTVRTWLGDQGAVGSYDLHGQSAEHPVPPITIALAITDQDKAEAYFATLPNAERYSSSSEADYTLYSPVGNTSSDPYYVFRDDVLIITGDAALAEAGGVLSGDSLTDNPAFTSALGLLPADQYSGIVYVDTPAVFSMMMESRTTSYMSASDQAMMEVVKIPYHYGGESPGVIGIGHDITQRKEKLQALHESEERWAFAVEGAGDGVWDWDMKTGRMLLSRLYEEMLGFSKGELAQNIEGWSKSVHPEDAARIQQQLQDYLTGKTPIYAVELRMRCKDNCPQYGLRFGTARQPCAAACIKESQFVV